MLAEVDKINNSGILPPGVRIERIYDRSDLIDITTHTVLHNMVMGVTLIFLLQWLFLGNLRSALIVSATIPFALLFAVVVLVLSGESANLLSMGAIDFGIIVDATVIMVENIFRHLCRSAARRGATRPTRAARPTASRGKLATIYHASTEVTQAIFFSATIIIAGFVPLFTLSGVEGHIFGPMAQTYAYALSGGLIATFTVSPALCRPAVAREGVGDRDVGGARAAALLRAGPRFRAGAAAASPCSPASALGVARASWPAARSGWNSCPSSRRATCGSAPSCRRRSRSRTATTTSTACAS